MGAPNDTTKFELAWLIVWIPLTIILLVLVVLRRLALPALIPRGDKIFSAGFAFLQLVVWVFILAALGFDGWSEVNTPGNSFDYGLVKGHSIGSQANGQTYDCSNVGDQDNKNMCGTQKTAGIFVLLFGLGALFNGLAMLIAIGAALLSQATPLAPHIAMMSNLQWVFLQAMMFLWAICFHDIVVQQQGNTDNLTLGASWVLTFICLLFSIPLAMYYGAGVGQPLYGGGSSSDTTPPPQETNAGPAVHVP